MARYLQSTLISPICGATQRKGGRKVLSFKHPPSMPSRLYILGLVRSSTPQEYRRTTMRLGCKSVSGCPAQSLSFSSLAQNAATALSRNGTLSIFPRLTYRFAECEKKYTLGEHSSPHRKGVTDLFFYAPISHTHTTIQSWLCQSVATIPGPAIWLHPAQSSEKRVQHG
jgi:hypothetical protein